MIFPERRVGTVPVGFGKNKVSEPLFKRTDVKIVKTSRKWFMLGREIKMGEQPLKHTAPRRLAGRKRPAAAVESDTDDGNGDGEGDDDEGEQTGLYAEFQTVLYEPPPVVNGLIPKNRYGNLDIFAPSMVPKGANHLPCKP